MKNVVGAEAPVANSKEINLTYCQWAVYYYLISISKYNSQKHENHRYIYKNSFTQTGIGKELGISRQTVASALRRLDKVGLVKEDVFNKEYLLIYANNWVEINLDVLLVFLEWAKMRKDRIDILRLYLCLKRIFAVAKSKSDRSFTVTDLMEILEHNVTDDSIRDNLKFSLVWLQYLRLVEFTTSEGYNAQRGKFVIYHLDNVMETTDHPEFNSSLAAEICETVLPDRIKQQVKFPYIDFEENFK